MKNQIIATMAILSTIAVSSSAEPMKITPTGVTFSDNSTQTSATDGHSLDAADGSPVDSVFVDNDGNVGIGTTTPSSKLHVKDTVDSKLTLEATNSGKVFKVSATQGLWSNDAMIFSNVYSGSAGERLRIDSTGNVGIGTNSPATTLDINGIMRLAIYSSAPFTCDAAIDGAIALTSNYMTCVCNGSDWAQTVDGETPCAWQ